MINRKKMAASTRGAQGAGNAQCTGSVMTRAAIENETKIEELKAKFASNVISMDSFICGLSGHTNLLA